MAVRPQRVPPRRRAAGVDEALLGDQHEGPLGMAARGDRGLGCGQLGERAAQVHRARPAGGRGRPRHRLGEGVVDLEGAGAIAVAAQGAGVAPGQRVAADRDQPARGHVEEQGPRRGQVTQRAHLEAGADLAPERAQVGGHRVGDGLGAAARHRPAGRVAEREQHEREPGRRRPVERPERVRPHSPQERAGGVRAEARRREAGHAADAGAREPGGEQRVARRPGRAQHGRGELVPALGERAHERVVCVAVRPELRRRLGQRPVQDGRPAAVERVGGLHLGLEQLEPVIGQRQRPQERRSDGEGVDGRADVVPVAGQGQLGCPRPAADRLVALAQEHRPAGAGQLDRGREAVRPRADHDGIGQPVSRPGGTAA
jgi:hypothetical protein